MLIGVATGFFCGCGPAAPVNTSNPSGEETTAARPVSLAAREPGPRDEDADAPTEFTTTESGLKYRILRKGSGPKPQSPDQVIVNYKGWLEDPEKPFDQSYGKNPFDFRLVPIGQQGQVIDGWNEGVTYVKEGGMIELEIPSELGYGEGGFPPVIPPNATLHFIVEVLEVK
ncbi:MAG: FKBP-type peptidyl-prolyl cis-trans isomerase [Planctomycetota bacterium]|nr:MAG: FKBP-type peptidyl-prolyl cis-trans isomerase [Planctomycetota bacterium]